MTAIVYFATAAALLALAHRYVTPLTRGAALALLLLPLVFTGRAVLTGRVYGPIELPYTTQPLADHRGTYHVPPPQNAILSDIAFQMIPWRQTTRELLAAHEWPLWNRFMQAGSPHAAGMQPAVFSPFTWIACLLPAAVSFGFSGAIAFFLAGLGAFAFAHEVIPTSATLGMTCAVAFAFSAGLALTILWPLGFTWALLPLVMLGTRRVIREPGVRSGGLLATALALAVVSGHPETLLHLVLIAGCYALFELPFARGRGMAVGAGMAAGVVALLVTAIALLPFFEALHASGEQQVRGLFADNPLPIHRGSVRAAVLGNLFPFLRGKVESFPIERADAGSIVFALALAAALRVRRREVWFFAALALFAFLAGSNVWPVAQLLHALPLLGSAFNDRLAIAVPFALAILALFAIEAWPRRTIAAVMGVWAAAIVAAAVLGGADIHRGRLVAELLPLVAAALLVLFSRKPLALPLLALILLQRTASDGYLVPVHPASMAYPPLKLLAPLAEVREPFRIAPLGGAMIPNTPSMYDLEDVRGSGPMTYAPFAETFPMWLERPPASFPQVNDLTRPILSMMNVRFSLQDVSTPIPDGWRDRGYDVYTRLIENERVLPRAFVPARVVFGRTPAEELAEMREERDFAQRAWLDAAESRHERVNGPGRVSASEGSNELTLLVSMEQPGFVVVSQPAWPGWRGWVDGRRVRLLGANHAFLGVYVPAGEHRVRLRYLPQSFVIGRAITAGTLLLVLLVTVASRFWTYHRRVGADDRNLRR